MIKVGELELNLKCKDFMMYTTDVREQLIVSPLLLVLLDLISSNQFNAIISTNLHSLLPQTNGVNYKQE